MNNAIKKPVKQIKQPEVSQQPGLFTTDDRMPKEIPTSSQWQVRRSLCLVLNMSMSRIYRSHSLNKAWNAQPGNKLDAKAGSVIVPACTLRTATLANSVKQVIEFFTSQPNSKDSISHIFTNAIKIAGLNSLEEYEKYKKEDEIIDGN